ncbi:MAG: NADP-dependent malic enzyme, partial [Oscillospiraceae bacterium]
TPGVAAPCLEIKENAAAAYTYTAKGNTVAVVTDGSAVLGLGNIGALAAIPVMEGKAALFKRFGDVDAIPICLGTQNADEIVRTVQLLAPSFGGINLEDICAPRCFEVEDRLRALLDIPVFHDDQHGTAIVVAAALTNALRVVGKELPELRLVLSGVGAAGSAIARLLLSMGAQRITLVDRAGIVRPCHMEDPLRKALAERLNPEDRSGTLADALCGADVLIGVSAPGIVTQEMIRSMNRNAIVFAMANPTPEILPDLALAAGARIVGTGRSDYPNQVNNSLAFPGLFRGALDAGAKQITEEMKIAAVLALAGIVGEERSETNIIPSMLDTRVAPAIARAVAAAWKA